MLGLAKIAQGAAAENLVLIERDNHRNPDGSEIAGLPLRLDVQIKQNIRYRADLNPLEFDRGADPQSVDVAPEHQHVLGVAAEQAVRSEHHYRDNRERDRSEDKGA